MMLNIYKWLCMKELTHSNIFPVIPKTDIYVLIKSVPSHLFREINVGYFSSFFLFLFHSFLLSLILKRKLKLIAKYTK